MGTMQSPEIQKGDLSDRDVARIFDGWAYMMPCIYMKQALIHERHYQKKYVVYAPQDLQLATL